MCPLFKAGPNYYVFDERNPYYRHPIFSFKSPNRLSSILLAICRGGLGDVQFRFLKGWGTDKQSLEDASSLDFNEDWAKYLRMRYGGERDAYGTLLRKLLFEYCSDLRRAISEAEALD